MFRLVLICFDITTTKFLRRAELVISHDFTSRGFYLLQSQILAYVVSRS